MIIGSFLTAETAVLLTTNHVQSME